jgi:hypothetical protein
MASLVGEQLKDTYDSLLKTSDNDALVSGSYKEITDGSGNGSNLYLGQDGNVGIGTSPNTDLHIRDSATENPTLIKLEGLNNGRGGTIGTTSQDGANDVALKFNSLFTGGTFGGHVFSVNDTEAMRIDGIGDISFRDTSANEAFYWDASTARLGLGTTSPNHQLEIYGGSGAGSYNLFRGFSYNGTTNKRVEININNTESDPIAIWNTTRSGGAVVEHSFQIDSSEKMRIDSSGNLGIGTDSPAVPSSNATTLHIKGAVATKGGAVRLSSSNDSVDAYLYPSSSSFNIGSITSHDVNIVTNNSPRMTIDSSGNVGIGTTSPKDTLDVVDGISVTDSNTALTTNTVLNGIDFYTSDPSFASRTSNRTARIVPISNDSVGQSFALGFYTASTDTDATERMRIDSDGNVGMNAVPENSSGTWRNYQLGSLSMAGRANDSNPDAMFGTNFKFTTANAEQRISAHATSRIFFNDDVITFQNAGSGTAGSAISWSPRMTIDSSGNVLVGKTSADDFSSAGAQIESGGQITTSVAGAPSLRLNRGTNDGDIIELNKGGITVGSIGVGNSNDLYIGNDDTGLVIQDNDIIAPWNPSTNALRDNAIDLGYTDRRFKDLYLSGSVYLGGTTSANALDDYEEGTWTPVVRGSGTAGTYELSSSLAYYTKVGRLVTIHLSIGLDDPITGGGSGYTQITGLPYAKANGFHTTAVVNSIGFDYTGDYLITRFTTAGDTSTKLGIFGNVDNGSLSLTPISGLSAGDSFTITVSYLT